MTIIETPSAMARALATFQDPWLKLRLSQYRDRLLEADCEVGDLGPVIVADPGDTLAAVEQAAGASLSVRPEYCEADHSGYELAYVTDDFGAGAVLLVPGRDDIDPALLETVRAHALTASTHHDHADQPEGQHEEPR